MKMLPILRKSILNGVLFFSFQLGFIARRFFAECQIVIVWIGVFANGESRDFAHFGSDFIDCSWTDDNL